MNLRNSFPKLLLSCNNPNFINHKSQQSLKQAIFSTDLQRKYSTLTLNYLSKQSFTSSEPKNNKNYSSTQNNISSSSDLSSTNNNQSSIQTDKNAEYNSQQDNENKKKFFDTSLDIKFTEENSNLIVNDYTNSPTHLKFSSNNNNNDNDEQTSMALQGFYQSDNGLSINQKSELQLKDNPLALKVLMEGKIDLRDERIQVTQLNTGDSALLGDIDGVHQISLGNVDVLPQNSILLEDIDVNNIPEDKDIIIDKNTKILLAVGKKVQKKKNRQTIIESSNEQENDQGQEEQGEVSKNKEQNSRKSYELSVNKKIFEELSLDEYKNKYLWNFEKEFAQFDFTMLMRSLIGVIPVAIIFGIFFDTAIELYKCKRDVSLMEEQLLNPFINVRRSLQQDILLNDSQFNRQKLFPEEYQQQFNGQKK